MNNLTKKLYLFLILTIILLPAMGQGKIVVQGTVNDISDGQPLIGVNIVEINKDGRFLNGCVSDIDGNFQLIVSNTNATIMFKYIGYATKNLELNGKTKLDINLELESSELAEIQVVASQDGIFNNGMERISKKNITTAVTSISMKEISFAGAETSVDQMLQGQASGVLINSASGDPGAGATIRIRGTASFMNGNEPLIIIDGIPFENDGDLGDIDDLENMGNSPIANVNPEDIESIQILKDAASTSMYGSKGGNGVILINTKRGRSNSTNYSFSVTKAIQIAPASIPLLNGDQLKILWIEAAQNGGSLNAYPELRDDILDPDYQYFNNNTDWVDLILQNGSTNKYNFSVRGGASNTRYRFSLGYDDMTGTDIVTGYERFTSRVNLDYDISKKLSFRGEVSYTFQDNKANEWKIKTTGTNAIDIAEPIAIAKQFPSFFPVYEQDRFGNDLSRYFDKRDFNNQGSSAANNYYGTIKFVNPVAYANNVINDKETNSFTGSLIGIFRPTKSLNITSQVSLNFSDMATKKFLPSVVANAYITDKASNLSYFEDQYKSKLSQRTTINYTPNIGGGKHFVNVMSSFTFNITKKDFYSHFTTNSASVFLQNASGAGTYVSPNDKAQVLKSYFDQTNEAAIQGSLMYAYDEFASIRGSLRIEGNSKYGEDNRYAYYPSISAALHPIKYFTEDSKIVNDFKLRYSFGINGVQPKGNDIFFYSYNVGFNYLNNIGITSNSLELRNLKWEEIVAHNAGFDLYLFENGRVSITGDYYHNVSSDVIMDRQIPLSAGINGNKVKANYGTIQNQGIELSVSAYVIKAKSGFSWKIMGNISQNRNKILDLPDDADALGSTEITINKSNKTLYAKVQEGDVIGGFYGYRSLGVYPTDEDAFVKNGSGNIVYDINGLPKVMRETSGTGREMVGGDVIYEDINKDGVINTLDIVQIGDSNPDFYGGLTNTFKYNNFQLQVFLTFQYGNDIYNAARLGLELMRAKTNKANSTMRRWRKQGDITDMPRATSQKTSNEWGGSRYVEDGSFMRINKITFRYNMPKKTIQKLGLNSVVFFLNGQNLYNFTNYSGIDPEVGSLAEPYAVGIDQSSVSKSINFDVGIKIEF